MIDQYNNPLHYVWYTDRAGNKISITKYNESYKVINNKVFLTHIPDSLIKINYLIINNSITIYESISGTEINDNNFIVDYENGIITVSSSYDGYSITIPSYGARGSILFPSSRIYLEDGTVVLQDKLDEFDTRLNNLLNETSGDKDLEIVDARYSTLTGTTYEVLKDRLDAMDLVDNVLTTKISNQTINVKYPPLSSLDAAHTIDEVGYDTFDSTNAINAMITYAYNNGIKEIFFPAGTYLCNITIIGGIKLKGAGKNNTILKSNNSTLNVIDSNKTLYITIEDMDIIAPYTQTATILNLTGSRYVVLNNLRINMTPNEFSAYSYGATGIDLSIEAPATWTGYNRIKNVQVAYCKYGLLTGGGLHSALSIEDCGFSWNGYYNLRLDGVSTAHIHNLDCANGGKLATTDEVNTELYGGMYIKGYDIVINGTWYESNHKYMLNSTIPNDCYIHPDSHNVVVNGERSYWSNSENIYFLEEEIKSKNSRHITPKDTGIGKGKPINIIPNNCFKYCDSSNNPAGWNKFGIPILSAISSNLPIGIDSAIQLTGTGGLTGLYYTIYDAATPTNGIINNITPYIGQDVIMTYYYKAATSSASGRAGFKIVSGTYLSTGDRYLILHNTDGKWVKVVQRYKITGTETFLKVQLQALTETETIQFTQVLFAFDDHVIDSGHLINENGLNGSITFDPSSLTNGSSITSSDVNVIGVNFGDFVLVSAPYDLQGIIATGYVSAENKVKIRLYNGTGSTIDLDSGIWKVKVLKN